MFPFPKLPPHWEKRLVFFCLNKLDLLEERTLGNLENLQGTAGKFTFKDIGIRVDRLRDILKIPPRLELREAVIGTLTVTLPGNIFLSSSVQIEITDVRVSALLTPAPVERPASPLRSSSSAVDDDPELPKTAEDLAESFLDAQTEEDKRQLMSIYAEGSLASSVTSTASMEEEDDIGVGASLGLPSVVTNIFKGLLDRLTVRVRRTVVLLDTILPEDRGGENVLLTVEINDVDVEGVSRNVSPPPEGDISERSPREGKRRITLESIQGYVTSVATLLEAEGTRASAVFGSRPKSSAEQKMGESTEYANQKSMESSAHTIKSPPTEPPRGPSRSQGSSSDRVDSLSSPPPPSRHETASESAEDLGHGADDDSEDWKESLHKGSLSVSSEEDRFMDFGEDSDDEVLAFAPTLSSLRSSEKLDSNGNGAAVQQPTYDDDSEDDVEGGAAFSPSMRPRERSKSPIVSTLNASGAAPDPPISEIISSGYDTDGSDEMDEEASKLLSESTVFSHKDADSIYMSATSGMLRNDNPVPHAVDQRDLEEGEEVDSQEMDDRLDRLLSGGDTVEDPPEEPLTPRPQSPIGGLPSIPRKVRKKCLNLDRVTVFYPALAGFSTLPEVQPEPTERHDSDYNHVPGAFSMYASRHNQVPQPVSPPEIKPVAKKSTPKVRMAEGNPTMGNDSIFGMGDINAPKAADIEIIVGDCKGTVDLSTEKALAYVLETFQSALQDGKDEKAKKTSERKKSGDGKTVQLRAEEMDIRMVERLPGVYLDTDEEIVGDPTVRLQCLLNDINLYRKPYPDADASTSKLDVKKFALSDEEEGIITFLPPLPPSTKTSRRRPNSSTSYGRRDISIEFSDFGDKKWLKIETNPIRLHFDLKRLEETFSAFGGVGSVLASTTASTATIKGKQLPLEDSATLLEPPIIPKIDASIGGLEVEIVGTSGQVKLSTSPIRVKNRHSVYLVDDQEVTQPNKEMHVEIESISVSGPQTRAQPTEIAVVDTVIDFLLRPGDEDLDRLLQLLTPSRDRFDTEDILVETLLSQRRQGSALKVSVGSVNTNITDPVNDLESLKQLGDEIVEVLTATDFVVSGDERPGLLTLVELHSVNTSVQLGGGIGLLQASMENVGITHVSAPSLVAMAITKMDLCRNQSDELIGEGLDKMMFRSGEDDRPVVMMRMVGDEPEPIMRIKLWNLKAEYKVETLLEMMQAPENATGETIAQEMVDSIIRLPPPKVSDNDAPSGMGFDIEAKDCVIGLNPLDSKSRGLLVLTDLQLQAALPTGGTLGAAMVIKKASVMVIDSVDNLEPADPNYKIGRTQLLNDHLAGFASMGYVPVVTVSSAKAELCVIENAGPNGEKSVDLNVKDDLLLLETCADSTQTLIGILNGLKPPLPETEEVKYCTEVVPVDMLASLDEGAFIAAGRKKPGDFEGTDDFQEVIAESPGLEVHGEFAFVDSYYGHAEEPSIEQPDAYGFQSIDAPSWVPPASKASMRQSVSREQVKMLDEAPLVFHDDYFGGRTQTHKSQKRLNDEAVRKTSYFPLRIHAKDVHFIWNLHDGYDWQRTRDTISQAVKKVQSRVAERQERRPRVSFDIDDDEDGESVVDDFLFNSIYIGIPANRDPRELHLDDQMSETSYAPSTAESSARKSTSRGRSSTDSSRRARGGVRLNRSRHQKMQFELKGINADVLLFPPGSGEVQSSVDLRVRDLEIFDNVPTSTWRKFLTYMQDAGGRELGSNMAHIEILNVKPVPELAASELVLKVSILPLRLHVDQDTLDFMTRFFEFKDDNAAPSKPPSSTDQPFLQRVEINAVRVKLDYKPKTVDYASLRSGRTTEFMNFFILEESDMVLRRVILHGIPGFTRMSTALNDTWMPDIKSTQLGDVVSGVAPVRSLVNLGLGVRNLVVVPVREYRKDGRVVRSLQKGVGRFVKTSATEMARLGAKIAVGTQAVLQGAENALEGPREILEFASDEEVEVDRKISLYADQPEGVVQGLRGASRSLRRNFTDARDTLTALPGDVAAGGSAGGAARAVARAVPRLVLRPMIGTSEAAAKTLQGATNSLDPDMKRRAEDKYKKPH